jgi:hypothetical protein
VLRDHEISQPGELSSPRSARMVAANSLLNAVLVSAAIAAEKCVSR